MIKKLILLTSLLFIGIQNKAFSGTISFDQLSISADLSVSRYNADLDKVYIKVNTAIQADNIENNTLQDSSVSSDFSTNASPSTRTLEGAACEKVFTGLLTATTSGTLVGTVPAGTAYPQGRRVRRDTAFSRTWTASRWTYVDIDHNNDLFFQETAIGAAAPSVTTNAIRLSRVSTDGTQILSVQDLRTTNCSDGPFQDIVDASSESSIEDLFTYGRNKLSADSGWIWGLQISYETGTSFSVRPGSAIINGKYRIIEVAKSIPTTNDDPSAGTSGLDTGAIAASTTYYVYAMADKASSKDLSVTYSINPVTPTGVTNYRRIGQIKTNASSEFISRDANTFHLISERNYITSHVNFDALSGTPTIVNGQNVSGFTDNGTGDWTVSWDTDYLSNDYTVVLGYRRRAGDISCRVAGSTSADQDPKIGTTRVVCTDLASGAVDPENIYVSIIGELRK